MEKEAKLVDGHYQLPLPFRNPKISLPDNEKQARARLMGLKKRLQKNPQMYKDYVVFMDNLLQKGFARKASDPKEKSWFTSHFGVYHPKKPDKIRVVFNYSGETCGTSLNDHLLQGPDMTNDLLGVLLKFRQDEVAIMADVEAMFHQVKIPEEHCRFLRFFWWQDGKLDSDMEVYEMTVHTFGAVSSPSSANYALKKTANDNESIFGSEAADVLRKNFYVDDMLKSVPNPQVAVSLLHDVINMAASRGFPLAKVISNSKEVLNSIPSASKAKSIKTLDLHDDPLPVERALGVHWCVESDRFVFRISQKRSNLNRRGILSSVASIYDPLGLAAPFLLKGRQILQELCAEKKGWDESLSTEQIKKWERWRNDLKQLEEISVPRCFKSNNFGDIKHASIHHFSDASDKGYGTASYLRLENDQGNINCSLVIGKSRVAPIKMITIPRMELTAATLLIKISNCYDENWKFLLRIIFGRIVKSYYGTSKVRKNDSKYL